ncbi:hypothetical protein ACFYWY_36655 [Streptomyces sp. NPDC002870]
MARQIRRTRRVGRPVIAVTDGHARMLVRRESLDDMSRRDIGP